MIRLGLLFLWCFGCVLPCSTFALPQRSPLDFQARGLEALGQGNLATAEQALGLILTQGPRFFQDGTRIGLILLGLTQEAQALQLSSMLMTGQQRIREPENQTARRWFESALARENLTCLAAAESLERTVQKLLKEPLGDAIEITLVLDLRLVRMGEEQSRVLYGEPIDQTEYEKLVRETRVRALAAILERILHRNFAPGHLELATGQVDCFALFELLVQRMAALGDYTGQIRYRRSAEAVLELALSTPGPARTTANVAALHELQSRLVKSSQDDPGLLECPLCLRRYRPYLRSCPLDGQLLRSITASRVKGGDAQ